MYILNVQLHDLHIISSYQADNIWKLFVLRIERDYSKRVKQTWRDKNETANVYTLHYTLYNLTFDVVGRLQ